METLNEIKGQTLDEMLEAPHLAAMQAAQDRMDLMHSMTGYQRAQAMKACKGDVKKLRTEDMRKFAAMVHPNALKRKYA